MPYRVCKSFHVESGHLLSKHPGLCRFPHGHSRRIDVVLSADALDGADMVCDFKALKLAVKGEIDRLDHAMAINSADPHLPAMQASGDRLVIYKDQDPTTEVMARRLFDFIKAELHAGRIYHDEHGNAYRLGAPGASIRIHSVRVTETATTWAEYSEA